MHQVATIEAQLALQVSQQRPAKPLGQGGDRLGLDRILNAAGDDEAAFALQLVPVGLTRAGGLRQLPGAPGLGRAEPVAEGAR
ncbi:hypothetical protein C3B79_1024 [Aeromonas hydrophila]|nr:hypothetical protein C3B79_1024 [Aeromonas hydrophila]